MGSIREITNRIKLLEEKLLNPEFRKSAEELIHLLDSDFIEVGSSGKVYNRDQVISALKEERPVKIAIKDFSVRILSDDVVLALYTSVNSGNRGGALISRRSSIWKKKEGTWHILYHQGTPDTTTE